MGKYYAMLSPENLMSSILMEGGEEELRIHIGLSGLSQQRGIKF